MKVLIIGLGSIARKHVKIISKLVPDVSFYAFRRSDSSSNIAGITNIYSQVEIPNDIDFVLVSNPSSLHYSTIDSVLHFKKPLFIEKPVLSSLSQGEILGEKITKLGIRTYVACNFRFHPAINRLKIELEKRRPLEINIYCGSFLPDWRPGTDYRSCYSSSRQDGGGVHLDLIHEIDYAYYLFGMPLEVSSYFGKKSDLEINSIDVAHYMLEYKEFSVFITLNYYRRIPKRAIEIVWDDDVWTVDLLRNTINSALEGLVFSEDYEITDTYLEQMKYFLAGLSSDNDLRNDYYEGLKVLSLCLYNLENAER